MPVRARGQAGRHLNAKTCVRTDEQGSRAGAQGDSGSSREGWKRKKKKEGGERVWKGSRNCLTISSNKYWRETE